MKLNTAFESILEDLPAEQVKKLMLWYASGPESVETQSQALQAILNEVETLDSESCYQNLESLSLQSLVSHSIMNEFGPSFAKRSCFNSLSEAVTRKIQEKPEETYESQSSESLKNNELNQAFI